MPTCASCGSEIEEGQNFCPHCGAPALPATVAAMIQDARQTLGSSPDDTAARYNLAIAYKLGGMDELAAEELTRVAAAQPDFADVHYELALLHAKHGRRTEARAALARVQKLDPEDARVQRLLERLSALD
jgi:Flp pilus assembly protein TadD